MPDRLAMMVAGGLPGISVTALCAELGISRQTYYRLKRRYDLEGPAGLEPRSRRPHHSPGKTGLAMELEILRLREELPVTRGAAAIAAELDRRGYPAPAPATVHRILRAAGLVRPSPQKRPRSSWRRFTYPDPNGCWQTDATDWQLADTTPVTICDVLDDHSRVLVAALVGPVGSQATAALAVQAFTAAATRWGLPARVLSDNGSCFGGVDRRGTFPQGRALTRSPRAGAGRPRPLLSRPRGPVCRVRSSREKRGRSASSRSGFQSSGAPACSASSEPPASPPPPTGSSSSSPGPFPARGCAAREKGRRLVRPEPVSGEPGQSQLPASAWLPPVLHRGNVPRGTPLREAPPAGRPGALPRSGLTRPRHRPA